MNGSPTRAPGSASHRTSRDSELLWVSEWWLPPASPAVEEGDEGVAVPRQVIGVEIPDRGLSPRLVEARR